MKRWLKVLLGFLLLVLVLLGGIYIGQMTRTRSALMRAVTPMGKLKATLQMISDNYVDSVNEDDLVSELIPMLIGQLDPHSTYLTAEQKQSE